MELVCDPVVASPRATPSGAPAALAARTKGAIGPKLRAAGADPARGGAGGRRGDAVDARVRRAPAPDHAGPVHRRPGHRRPRHEALWRARAARAKASAPPRG